MKTIHLGKGKNTLVHVNKGRGNVWYCSTNLAKLNEKGCKHIESFTRRNDLMCSIHGSRLPLVDLD